MNTKINNPEYTLDLVRQAVILKRRTHLGFILLKTRLIKLYVEEYNVDYGIASKTLLNQKNLWDLVNIAGKELLNTVTNGANDELSDGVLYTVSDIKEMVKEHTLSIPNITGRYFIDKIGLFKRFAKKYNITQNKAKELFKNQPNIDKLIEQAKQEIMSNTEPMSGNSNPDSNNFCVTTPRVSRGKNNIKPMPTYLQIAKHIRLNPTLDSGYDFDWNGFVCDYARENGVLHSVADKDLSTQHGLFRCIQMVAQSMHNVNEVSSNQALMTHTQETTIKQPFIFHHSGLPTKGHQTKPAVSSMSVVLANGRKLTLVVNSSNDLSDGYVAIE